MASSENLSPRSITDSFVSDSSKKKTKKTKKISQLVDTRIKKVNANPNGNKKSKRANSRSDNSDWSESERSESIGDMMRTVENILEAPKKLKKKSHKNSTSESERNIDQQETPRGLQSGYF